MAKAPNWHHVDGPPEHPALAAVYRELRQVLPGLVRVELRHREGIRRGRLRSAPTAVLPITDSTRDADRIVAAIAEEAEAIEEREGPCVYGVTLIIDEQGQERDLGPFTFRLDDSGGDAHAETVALLQKTIRYQDQLTAKLMGRLSEAVDTISDLSRGVSELLTRSADVARVQAEHERWQAEHEAAREQAHEEMELIRELAPKVLAAVSARQARREHRERGEPPRPSWRRLVDVAASIRHREELRAELGEDGRDLLDALAEATDRAAVEAIVGRLRELVRSGKLDVWRCLELAPELAAFADLLA